MLHAHERVTAADLHGRTGRSDQLECRPCGPRSADLEGRSGLGPFPPIGHGVKQRKRNLALAVLEERRPRAGIGAHGVAVFELRLVGQPQRPASRGAQRRVDPVPNVSKPVGPRLEPCVHEQPNPHQPGRYAPGDEQRARTPRHHHRVGHHGHSDLLDDLGAAPFREVNAVVDNRPHALPLARP